MPIVCFDNIKTDWNIFYKFRGEQKRILIAKGLVTRSQKFNDVLTRRMKKKFGHN